MVSPLQEFNDKHHERWTVLTDIPEWIIKPLHTAIDALFFDNYGRLRDNVVTTIEREMRLSLSGVTGISFEYESRFESSLMSALKNASIGGLLLLDIVIKYIRDYAPSQVPFSDHTIEDVKLLDYLDSLLANGSKWMVVDEAGVESGIVERVEPHVLEIAQKINNSHLTEAWNLAFQVKPQPEKAIMAAQNAIEDIATSSGFTSLTTGIYGGIIGDIKSNPDKYISAASGAFTLQDELNKQKNDINDRFAQWIKDGLDFVQLTNPGRHKAKAVKDFKLDPLAGQQAVVMATLLGWMIKEGVFKKVKPRSKSTKVS
ncbi:MAG: hypothetical protein ABIP74_01730 [Candidatus Saccharimonas sp.]